MTAAATTTTTTTTAAATTTTTVTATPATKELRFQATKVHALLVACIILAKDLSQS